MTNFEFRLQSAIEALATGEGMLKERLRVAIANHLIDCESPHDRETPSYFKKEHIKLMEEVTRDGPNRVWPGAPIDPVRVTLHNMRKTKVVELAQRIWDLYIEFQEYERSGFIPAGE